MSAAGSRKIPLNRGTRHDARARRSVGIVFGGIGPEHEASLSSARAAIDRFDRGAYDVTLFGISKEGSWLVGEGAWRCLYDAAERDLLPEAIRSVSPPESKQAVRRFSGYPDNTEFESIDCLLLLVDGIGGEDGTLQGFFSVLGKPFTGSGLLASAMAYDKWIAKHMIQGAGVPVAKGIRLERFESLHRMKERIIAEIGHWNIFVKPACCGSSFGVARVSHHSELERAVHSALRYSASVLVEEYIDNLELSVAVLGNAPDLLVARPVLLDNPSRSSHSTYVDKYVNDKIQLKSPTGLGDHKELQARRLARTVYEAMGCRGFARVDLFYRQPTGEMLFNEINTIPALAADCAFPMAMALEGIGYAAMLERMIQLALEEPAAESERERAV